MNNPKRLLTLLSLCLAVYTLRGPSSSSPRPELHPAGLQVVDMQDFRFLINPDICGQHRIRLVTIVNSAIPNKAARAVVRSTWGRPALPGSRLLFLVGSPGDPASQRRLQEESTQHGDLLQGGFIDTYRNLTYKTVMGKLWVATFCPQAELVVKADDDSYIDLYAAATLGWRHLDSHQYRSGHWIAGPVRWGEPVQRGHTPPGKWDVTAEEVSPALTHYPPFCNGIFYMTNPATAARMVRAARLERYLFIDDLFVTGFLREKLNITIVEITQFQTYSVDSLVRSKALQSAHTYRPDYINGLLARDGRQRLLCTVLDTFARASYQNRCLNNIYHPQYEPTDQENQLSKFIDKTFSVNINHFNWTQVSV